MKQTPFRRNFWVMAFLAVSNTTGVYATLGFLLFAPVPNENRELVSMILGNIVGFMAGIVTYHFGSSAESSEKNQSISSLAAAMGPAPTVAPPGSTITATTSVDVPDNPRDTP